MNCRKANRLICRSVEGLIGSDEKLLLARHLEECRRCSEEYADLLGLDCLLASALPLQATLGDDFAGRIAENLPGRPSRPLTLRRETLTSGSRRRPMLPAFGWRPALALLAVVVILISGIYDWSCQNRIAMMMEMPGAVDTPYAICGTDVDSSKFHLDRLLASQSVGNDMFDGAKGNSLL